jgi:hypothetical protein
MQTSRLTSSQFLKDLALRDSDFAVTELKNAQQFGDRAAAIGAFMFVVNIRLHIVSELANLSFGDIAFRNQISEWVGIVRNAANVFENEVRSVNSRHVVKSEDIVGEELDCAYDIEAKKVICEVVVDGHRQVKIHYSNISETIDYRFNSDVPGSGQPFSNVSAALNRGILDDLEMLGINEMRRLASIWEATGRVSGLVQIWSRIMGRSLLESEHGVMIESAIKGKLDTKRIVRGLLQTPEFLSQVGLLSNDANIQDAVKTVFTRALGRDPELDELRINSEIHDRFGYDAFTAMLSALVSTSEEGRGNGRQYPKTEAPTLNPLDVLRSLI